MRDATLADPARPGASQTPGMGVEDAITVASEGRPAYIDIHRNSGPYIDIHISGRNYLDIDISR
jgi:hypothetical protein